MTTNRHTPLFRLSCKFLKYFFLALLGLFIVYYFSIAMGVLNIIPILMFLLEHLYLPLATLLLGLVALAVIFESLR